MSDRVFRNGVLHKEINELMFIIIPTSAHVSRINLILKLLPHVSVFLHHLQGAYKLCQLELWLIKMIKYNTAVCRCGKTLW